MGCCFYDLCSPRRKIYGKQSSGEPSQSPRFNKHSLITRHRGQTSEGVEPGREERRSPARGGGRGAWTEGRSGRRGPLPAHFPLGGAGPATTALPGFGFCCGSCQGRERRYLGCRKRCLDGPGEGGSGRGRREAFCPPSAWWCCGPWLVSPISAMAAPGKLGSGWTQGERWGRGAGALHGLEESRSQAARGTVRSRVGHLSPTLS